jgi:hypothetical protein
VKWFEGQFCEADLEADDDVSKHWSWTSGGFEWADASNTCVWTSLDKGPSVQVTAWLGTYEQASLEWADYQCSAELKWDAADVNGTRGVLLRANGDSSDLDALNGIVCRSVGLAPRSPPPGPHGLTPRAPIVTMLSI